MSVPASSNGNMFGSSDAQLRYEAYSRLQAAAVAFGESLPIPEIVAIGGQSDGKSSLLEAFLGVRLETFVVVFIGNEDCHCYQRATGSLLLVNG